jgi:hypothetical protein
MKSCILLFAVLVPVASLYADWQMETVEEGDSYYAPSLVISSEGQPSVVYSFSAGGLCYACRDSSQWMKDTLTASGTNPSLVLGPLDDPHITFFDDPQMEYAIYSSQWYITTVDNGGENSSIALDRDNYQHIAYYDQENDDLKYAFYDDVSGWVTEVVDSIGNVGAYPSLVLDSSDTPHIVYFDWGSESLYYTFWDSGSWVKELVCNNSNGPPYYHSLAIDAQDELHLAFCTFDSGTFNADLFCATRTGSVWNVEPVDTVGMVGLHCSLALDSDDHPSISYFDSDNAKLNYAHYDGSGWQIEEVCDCSGMFISLAISNDNKAHIIYNNYNVLMHAWQMETGIGEGITTGETGSLLLSPNPASGSVRALISLPSSDHATVSIFDLTGRCVDTAFEGVLNEGVNSFDMDVSHLPAGVYILELKTGTVSMAERLVLVE